MEIDLTSNCAADIVNDGVVDGQDLLVLLGSGAPAMAMATAS